MVVMDDADLDLAVEGALFGGFGTAGQRCTSLGTLIVHESVHDEFLARLSPRVEGAAIGDPTQDVLYGPMIHERFLERFEEWLGLDRGPPLRARLDGHGSHHRATTRARASSATPSAACSATRRSSTACAPDDELAAPRRSGRSSASRSFSDFDEAIALANGHGYGLSSSIYTTDPKHAFRFRERISAGMVSVNNSTSGAEAHLPFGGNGRSGNGARQSGHLGARPVHALAVDELGLRGQAAEGADGRRPTSRPTCRSGLPD